MAADDNAERVAMQEIVAPTIGMCVSTYQLSFDVQPHPLVPTQMPIIFCDTCT